MLRAFTVTRWASAAALALALLSARASLVTYKNDRAGFLANSGATSIGALPTDTSGVTSKTIGVATFVTDSGSLFFGDFSTRVAGNEMIITGQEDFHTNLSSSAYAFGLDIYEPNFGGPVGCNGPCVDTTFTLEFFAGNVSLGKFTYNAPDDDGASALPAVGFFGVHSSVAFNRIVVNDVTGNIDNEFFANFLSGSSPLQVTGGEAREPGSGSLVVAALLGLFAARRGQPHRAP